MLKDKNSKEIIKKGKKNLINVNTQKVKQKTTPLSLPISESAAAHFFVVDF
jgi:hypothetical protein